MSDQPVQDPKPKGKGGRPRGSQVIPPLKWAEVEADWADGKFASAEQASKKHGIDAKLIAQHMSRAGIKRGENIEKYNRQLQQELEEKAAKHAKVLAERIEETNEEHYRWSSGIAKLTFAEIATARQDKTPLSAIRGNLQSLESAMKVLKMAREERYAVLGLNDQDMVDEADGLPELAVAELTNDQIEEMRSRDVPEDDDDDDGAVEVLEDLSSGIGEVEVAHGEGPETD